MAASYPAARRPRAGLAPAAGDSRGRRRPGWRILGSSPARRRALASIPDMLPQRIGRYDVSAELGRGSTSIVYKGVDPVDGRAVAVKTLLRNGEGDADADADAILLRFRNEARTIGRLRHPGIVAVDEFGEDGLHSWIAMEYVDGGTLDDLLARGPLPGQERALAIVDELLDALGSVHAQGICHRDVKPANILVTAAGRVKLTDFGVARLRDLGLTRVSSLIGTPAFMAPEQFTGGAIDGRADLFACGVLLVLLLAGRRPFSGAPAAVMHQILNEEPPLLSEASGGLVGRAFDGVVQRALAKRADDRFATADEMRAALRAAASQAARSPLATLVETVVQDTGHPYGSLPADRAAPAAPRSGDTLSRLVMTEARGPARLVDAASLYSPGSERAGAVGDPDGTHVARSASSGDGLAPEVFIAAQRLLTRQLGPVADTLVKRAADAAGGSRHAFVANLVAEVSASPQAALRAELEALLDRPQRAGSGR
jgi:serine/threonine protein kinase